MPLLLLKATIPDSILTAGAGGWGFLYYLWFLIAGFIIISSDRLQQIIIKQRWLSLLSGLVLFSLIGIQYYTLAVNIIPGSFMYWVKAFVSFVNAWAWILAILGFGMIHFQSDKPLLRYANDAVLPFYILHQTILLVLGYLLIDLAVNDLFKWIIIFSFSFIVIVVLYELLIRRIDILRFIFGMKTVHRPYIFMHKSIPLVVTCCFPVVLGIFAALNSTTGTVHANPDSELSFDVKKDILMDSSSIVAGSKTGVLVVSDHHASTGKAIQFNSGKSDRVIARPIAYVDMEFTAPAGHYNIWVRGKSDSDDDLSDSVWMQFDEAIGTNMGVKRIGNWLNRYPAGSYGWISDAGDLRWVILKRDGKHKMRIQPRQTPHFIDQIWLSRTNTKRPEIGKPIRVVSGD